MSTFRKMNPRDQFIFAAQLSFSNISFGFSLISLGSIFDNLKLNTPCLPFSISVLSKKCWQALSSCCNYSLFLSNSSDSSTFKNFSNSRWSWFQLWSMFRVSISYVAEENKNLKNRPSILCTMY